MADPTSTDTTTAPAPPAPPQTPPGRPPVAPPEDTRPTDVTDHPGRDEHGGRYFGQTALAIEAGLSAATVESVRQGCYSDAQLWGLIHDLKRRSGEPAEMPDEVHDTSPWGSR